MTGDDTQVGFAHRRRAAVHVKPARPLGDIVAPEQFRRALGNELVARPVKAPAPHPQLVPGFRHGVTHRRGGHPLIKRRFEQADQRDGRHPLSEEPDAGDIGRVVRRRDAVERFHRLHHVFVEPHAAVDAAGHDGLEADRRQVAFASNVAGLFELEQAIPDRLRIIGHALEEAAFVQKALLAV